VKELEKDLGKNVDIETILSVVNGPTYIMGRTRCNTLILCLISLAIVVVVY
jgi:hypothetical protein